jgi:hypothetical protein
MANLEYEIARMTKEFKTAKKELYNYIKEFTKQLKIVSQTIKKMNKE